MKRFFGMDTKLYRFCAMAWNLIYLNLMTLLCCIPIVTAGASLTAMYYVLLKLVRREESHLWPMFRRAFKQNFRQATLLWLAILVLFAALRLDWVMAAANAQTLGKPVQYAILILAIVSFLLIQFLFPLLSHFENTIPMTLRNAAILAVSKAPRTIVMALVWALPCVILTHSLMLFPVVVMLGLTFPGFICAKLCDSVFKLLEAV